MSEHPTGGDPRLQRCRRLWEGRRYAELVAELGPLPPDALEAEPALGYFLADALHRLGERERALELTQRLADAFARRGNDRLARERLNLEGALLFGRGDLAGAEEAWSRLLRDAMGAGDEVMAARAGHNFGVLHTVRGEWQRAVVSHQRAAAAYQRLGHLRGLAQVHNNLAMTYREMDFFPEADRHFLQALEYASVSRSDEEAGRARIERALLLCYAGDLALGDATARLALRFWERLGDALHLGEAHRALAVVALAGQRWPEMAEQARRALELAQRARAGLLEAETRDLLGIAARQTGDEPAAQALHAQATELFRSMGAEAWGAGLRRRMEGLVGEASSA